MKISWELLGAPNIVETATFKCKNILSPRHAQQELQSCNTLGWLFKLGWIINFNSKNSNNLKSRKPQDNKANHDLNETI